MRSFQSVEYKSNGEDKSLILTREDYSEIVDFMETFGYSLSESIEIVTGKVFKETDLNIAIFQRVFQEVRKSK